VTNTTALNTAATAKTLGIFKATLLTWTKQGKIEDVRKDRMMGLG